MRRALFTFAILCAILGGGAYTLSVRSATGPIAYGVTFSVPYAIELGLDWKIVYRALLNDLGVRHLRIPVYWNRVEAERDRLSFDEIDYQVREAAARGADVILAIGRRTPRWPECHVPGWAQTLQWHEQKQEILALLRATVERYRNEQAIVMWQVENEPFLRLFAETTCGSLDEAFLKEEIALVRSLDARPILQTDGGNFGTWVGAYRAGDVFGTSMYLYFWRADVGAFRTILPPAYYRAKTNLMAFLFGSKPVILSELSLEPWLAASIEEVSVEEQLRRMSPEKFDEIVEYARESSFEEQYLWGVEWWYWMRAQGHPEFWDRAKRLFK